MGGARAAQPEGLDHLLRPPGHQHNPGAYVYISNYIYMFRYMYR